MSQTCVTTNFRYAAFNFDDSFFSELLWQENIFEQKDKYFFTINFNEKNSIGFS